MKLRIQGDSLRLRVSPSEMASLVRDGRIADTIHFGARKNEALTYALEHNARGLAISLRQQPGEIAVVVPTVVARNWAKGDEVGLYAEIAAGDVILEVAIEKDFACLDKSDENNADTFPNPQQGAVC